MIIVCPRCGILYGVDPNVLAAEACKVRCSNCDGEWLHTRAAALPDNDDALRLLAASFGRDAQRPPAPPVPHRAEGASPEPSARREQGESRPVRPRPRPLVVKPELELRPAPVTTLYPPAPAMPAAVEEPSSRAGRLSSRQLDALLNGDANVGQTGTEASDISNRKPEPRTEDRGEQPGLVRSSPSVRDRAAPEAAPVEPARALNAAAKDDAEDEAVSLPPPPEGDAAEAGATTRRMALLRRHRTAGLALAAVAATLIVSFGLLAATRGLVMAAFPGAAGFYSAVGLTATDGFAQGLEIRDVSSSRSWSDGEQILTVAGDLANVARQPRNLPMVRVVLVDGSDAEVQEVVVLPPGETLLGGETVRFEARISNPADTAERIKVSLAPRPETS